MLTIGGAALAAIAIADLLFAVDSVPAILAITDDAFIVFAANAFALLGLRPLFFLVADLVERLYYLKTALAALLAFIASQDGRAASSSARSAPRSACPSSSRSSAWAWSRRSSATADERRHTPELQRATERPIAIGP